MALYADLNPKTKKLLKEMVADPTIKVRVHQPEPVGLDSGLIDGDYPIEGPHHPQPHKWYATGTVEQGILIKVK